MSLDRAIENLDDSVRLWLHDVAVATDITTRQRYAIAWKARKDLEDIIKGLETEIGGLEETLINEFIDEGMESVRLSEATLYLARQLWAGRAEGADGGELAATLEELGLEQFLTVNSSTISSWVRELAKTATGEDHPSAEAAMAALPAPLRTLLKVEEKVNIRGRRR